MSPARTSLLYFIYLIERGYAMEVNEWVVVASKTQAKIFKRTDTTRPLKWIYTLVNKEGRFRDRNRTQEDKQPVQPIIADKNLPEEVNMERFAKKIADTLKVG